MSSTNNPPQPENNQTDIDSLVLRALMTAPNSMMEKTINDKPLTVFEVQNYKILTQAINKAIQEARIDELEQVTQCGHNTQSLQFRIDTLRGRL